jgi:hypothetical protein
MNQQQQARALDTGPLHRYGRRPSAWAQGTESCSYVKQGTEIAAFTWIGHLWMLALHAEQSGYRHGQADASCHGRALNPRAKVVRQRSGGAHSAAHESSSVVHTSR